MDKRINFMVHGDFLPDDISADMYRSIESMAIACFCELRDSRIGSKPRKRKLWVIRNIEGILAEVQADDYDHYFDHYYTPQWYAVERYGLDFLDMLCGRVKLNPVIVTLFYRLYLFT